MGVIASAGVAFRGAIEKATDTEATQTATTATATDCAAPPVERVHQSPSAPCRKFPLRASQSDYQHKVRSLLIGGWLHLVTGARGL